MQRRSFLTALLAAPAIASFLQACGDDDGGAGPVDGSSTTAGGSGGPIGFARSPVARLAADPAAATDGARALNALGVDLYQRLAALGEPNIVFSPASIMLALAMTRAGAVGTTASEMDTVLHTAEAGGDPAVHTALNALSAALESRSGSFVVGDDTVDVQLSIANSLWGQQGLTWVEGFLDLLAREYGAGMRLVDYLADPEAARAAINAWVADETEDRIPQLLDPGTITPDSRLTLVNAVYLKAPWLEPFLPESTAPADFTTAAGTTVQVPVMRTSRSLPYAKGDGWQAVELPYASRSLAMLLVVPDDGALADTEAALADGLLDEAVGALGDSQVNLGLPRFDLETKADLNEIMAALGMPTAFDPTAADFAGMTAEEKLFIGVIIHQANITVDEKGTEAAAATAVGMRATSAPVEVVDLVIDRPFLYAVRDVPTGAVLFMGRVSDPS
jgi:serpin B